MPRWAFLVTEAIPNTENNPAEFIPAIPDESQAAPPQIEGADDGTGGTQAGSSAVEQGEGTPEASPSAVGEAQGQETGFEAAFQKVTGKKPEVEPERSQLPGRSLEDAAAELRQRQAANYVSTMQNAETTVRGVLEQTYGFSKEQSHEFWTQHGRSFLDALHSNNEAFNLVVMDNLLREVLTEQELAEYAKRDLIAYDESGNVLALSSRRNGLKAVLALREQSVDAKWQEKLEKGEILTRDQGRALYEEGLAEGERRREAAQSGSTPRGSGMPSGADLSTVSGLSKALAEGWQPESEEAFDKLWTAALEKAGGL